MFCFTATKKKKVLVCIMNIGFVFNIAIYNFNAANTNCGVAITLHDLKDYIFFPMRV